MSQKVRTGHPEWLLKSGQATGRCDVAASMSVRDMQSKSIGVHKWSLPGALIGLGRPRAELPILHELFAVARRRNTVVHDESPSVAEW